MLKIAEIKDKIKFADITVKVVTIREKEYENEKGKGSYYYGIVGDETGTLPLTAWVFPSTVQAGDVIELKNCSVRKYNDRLRIYADSRSEVVLRPDDKMEVKRTYKEYKVKDLNLKDQYVAVSGIITGIEERTYEKDGRSGVVYSGIFADDTGTVRISSFGVKLKENLKARITGARVQEYRGRIGISINENSVITPIEMQKPGVPLYRISELSTGISGIEVTGICVMLGERSGLSMRCPECRKRVDDGNCQEHPDAKPYVDLYAYFTLEDGTSTMQCSIGRDALAKFTGIKTESLEYSEDEIGRIHGIIEEKIMGKPLLLKGESTTSPQGLSFRAEELTYIDSDVIKKVQAIMRMGID
ncbi:MAG: hypothetical protein ACYDAZ_08460 [Thermoplasmataceae archaeon]